jgi:tetratricopeptide (TPR) repeat protein
VDPDLPQANIAMGLASEPLADTLKYFRHAIELDPSSADAYHLVGDVIADFDSERALAFFRKSLELDSRFDVNHTAIADALWRLGRDEEARNELKSIAPTGRGSFLVARARALADLHTGRYREAAAGLAAMPNLRSTPTYWAALVTAMQLAGRADDALTEASALVARFPQDCEAKVLLAALRFEHRDAAAAHKLADGPLALANLESALPSDLRCGLHAAAALQNGPRAAALLDRVSGSEPMLRAFAQMVTGRSGTMWIDARIYPWSLVARQPAVAEARERLDTAYARERDVARAALTGLP